MACKYEGLTKSVYSLQYIIGHELTSSVTSVLRGKRIRHGTGDM